VLTIYQTEIDSSKKANAVTWVVGDDLETIVRVLKAKSVVFEHFGHRPGMVLSTGAVSETDADKATSDLEECQQIGVELVFMRVREAMGCARVDL